MTQAIIHPGTPEWLADRATVITSTDTPALLGVTREEGRYKDSTPYKIARRIKIARGLMKGEQESDADDSDLLYAGSASEDLNAKLYERVASRELGSVRRVRRMDANYRRHPQYDWLASTTDGVVVAIPHMSMPGDGVWEAKMPLYGYGKWRDGPPLAYKLQTLVSMAIRSSAWGSISGLRLPVVDWCDIEFDPTAWGRILAHLQAWYERYILQDQMPEAEAGDSGLLADLHRPEPRKTIYLPLASPLDDEAHRLADLKAQAKALDEEIDATAAKIKQHLQQSEAEIAMTHDGTVGWQFRRYIEHRKAKPATEARDVETVKFEAFKPRSTS